MSLLSWFGGKSSSVFINFINSKIPKQGIKTYVEPFSGAMGTYMDDNTLIFDNVIFNDMNRHQVNIFKCACEPNKLLEEINNLLSDGGLLYTTETEPIKKWDFYKSIYREYIKNDFLDDMSFEIGDFKKAAIYAFLITSSFSSVYPRGGGFSGYKKNIDKLKLESLINKLKKNKYTDKLKSITSFNNIDFEELILKYDSEDTYLYLDPPYQRYDNKTGEDDAKRLFWYGSDSDGVFGPASHRRLLELIKRSKSRWSLSYYYFPLLEELLPKNKYFWFEKEVFRSSAHGGKNHDPNKKHEMGTELLILNYDPETGIKI
jgi:site-specific DNA-adenine methylase